MHPIITDHRHISTSQRPLKRKQEEDIASTELERYGREKLAWLHVQTQWAYLKYFVNVLPEISTASVLRSVLESVDALIRLIGKEEIQFGKIEQRNAERLREQSRAFESCVPPQLKERSLRWIWVVHQLEAITVSRKCTQTKESIGGRTQSAKKLRV